MQSLSGMRYRRTKELIVIEGDLGILVVGTKQIVEKVMVLLFRVECLTLLNHIHHIVLSTDNLDPQSLITEKFLP